MVRCARPVLMVRDARGVSGVDILRGKYTLCFAFNRKHPVKSFPSDFEKRGDLLPVLAANRSASGRGRSAGSSSSAYVRV